MDEFKRRDELIERLRNKLRKCYWGVVEGVPAAILQVAESRAWEERYSEKSRGIVKFASFLELLQALPPEGIGEDPEQIRRYLAAVKTEEATRALVVFDELTAGRQGERTDLHDNVREVDPPPARPYGNSKQAALRRLKRDRPDLLERVVAGEVSANAAMIAAGFRKKTTPLDALRRAWKRATPADHAALFAEYPNEVIAALDLSDFGTAHQLSTRRRVAGAAAAPSGASTAAAPSSGRPLELTP